MTAGLAWIAVLLDWAATFLCGRRRRSGWLILLAAAVVWSAVNIRLQLWAGVLNSAVVATLAAHNWHRWRHSAQRHTPRWATRDPRSGRPSSATELRELPATDPTELADDRGEQA